MLTSFGLLHLPDNVDGAFSTSFIQRWSVSPPASHIHIHTYIRQPTTSSAFFVHSWSESVDCATMDSKIGRRRGRRREWSPPFFPFFLPLNVVEFIRPSPEAIKHHGTASSIQAQDSGKNVNMVNSGHNVMVTHNRSEKNFQLWLSVPRAQNKEAFCIWFVLIIKCLRLIQFRAQRQMLEPCVTASSLPPLAVGLFPIDSSKHRRRRRRKSWVWRRLQPAGLGG